jgi:hypothetical protein
MQGGGRCKCKQKHFQAGLEYLIVVLLGCKNRRNSLILCCDRSPFVNFGSSLFESISKRTDWCQTVNAKPTNTS